MDGKGDLPIWGFDGSSTNQAPGKNSDCVLKPVFSCPDPVRGGSDVLVMCEVLLTDMTPHPTNTRAQLCPVAEKFANQAPLFGIEQEYTFFEDGRPHGFPVGVITSYSIHYTKLYEVGVLLPVRQGGL